MFDVFSTWKHFWNTGGGQGQMPLTEKEPGRKVVYPYPLKKIALDDLDIAYVDVGDPTHEVVLFIHGMGSGVPVWRKNINELKKSHRCIALDLPGHGYSTKKDFPFTMRFYVNVVLSFLERLGISSISVVGHSMGGQIAFLAALREPTVVKSVVLVSPAGFEPYTEIEKQMLIGSTASVVASGNAFTHHRINQMVGFCNNQKEAAELVSRLAFFKDDALNFSTMMLKSVKAMLLEPVDDIMEQLSQPCLIIVGEEDRVSPYQFLRGQQYAETIRSQSSRIPKGKFTLFPNCGHFIQYQRPKLFNTELLGFLTKQDTKAIHNG
jgi:pimeloyl-ACP methyl ester carboxylesterase